MGAGGMVRDEPRSKPPALNEYNSKHKPHCTSLLLLTLDSTKYKSQIVMLLLDSVSLMITSYFYLLRLKIDIKQKL